MKRVLGEHYKTYVEFELNKTSGDEMQLLKRFLEPAGYSLSAADEKVLLTLVRKNRA